MPFTKDSIFAIHQVCDVFIAILPPLFLLEDLDM